MISELRKLEEMGYVRAVSHRDLPLLVWNYTPKCQYDSAFGDYPILFRCRGLITDLDGNVKLTGYSKFYNWEQHQPSELPLGSKNYTIETKLDGSLLIVGRVDGNMVYSTRGSFYSDQSLLGARLFKELYNEDWIEEGYSYLFELIGPSNRIVNLYPSDTLILHGLIDTQTGLDAETVYPFKRVETHEVVGALFGEELYKTLSSLNTPNEEGFVLKVKESGLPTWMVKIKFQDYCILHKLVTGLSSIQIWEYLKGDKSFDDILAITPDEFNIWLKEVKENLESDFATIESEAKIAYEAVKELPSRKEQAVELLKTYPTVSAIVFKMLNGDDYADLIWRQIKPSYDQPFTNKGEL